MAADVRRVGIEHEYVLVDPTGAPVDLRDRLRVLSIPGVRADPGDPLAVRCEHGGVITADGPHAEVATPPLPVDPSVLDGLQRHVDACVLDLLEALEPAHRLLGYSTHVSASCRPGRERRVAEIVRDQWGPALMLFGLHRGSPGLLVRPRWHRVEIGCEFLGPGWLGPAVALTAAATAQVEGRPRAGRQRIQLRVAPSRQRFGWYLDRTATGCDLVEAGRRALLRTDDGRAVRAQDYLESLWELAAADVMADFGAPLAAEMEAMIDGRSPLPVECDVEPERDPPPPARLPRHAFTYRVGAVDVHPVALTWRRAVFEVRGAGRDRWISVPGEECVAFLSELHTGMHDEALLSGQRRRRLRTGPTSRD